MNKAKTQVVIATGNPHKVRELQAILACTGIEFLGLKDLTHANTFQEPQETGDTFEENATIKALSYAQQTGLPCLADDSGLEVDALDGAPGVISSHYCTDGLDTGMTRAERDAANNQKLLKALQDIKPEKRSARFVCVMVLAEKGNTIAITRGSFEGRIGLPNQVPRGDNGFGYDPLFLVAPTHERTSAELSPQEKNTRSHRAAAAHDMLKKLAHRLAQ